MYSEGYPHTPLRPSNKKTTEGGTLPGLGVSYTPEEILRAAMNAKEIGVGGPSPDPELGDLREDNDERLAMERLR